MTEKRWTVRPPGEMSSWRHTVRARKHKTRTNKRCGSHLGSERNVDESNTSIRSVFFRLIFHLVDSMTDKSICKELF